MRGALAQCIPFHLLTFEQVQSQMVSMLDVLPEVSLWEIYPGVEFCLISHKTTEPVSYDRLVRTMSKADVQTSLDSIGITNTADLLNGFVTDTDGVRRLASEAMPVTDDCPWGIVWKIWDCSRNGNRRNVHCAAACWPMTDRQS